MSSPMNVNIVRRRGSISSTTTAKTTEESVTTVRVQPLELPVRRNDIVQYQITSPRRKGRKKRRSGYCSKTMSNYVMLKTAFPPPEACASPAEVLLKSCMETIKKESFWAEDYEIEHQQVFTANHQEAGEGERKTSVDPLDQNDEDVDEHEVENADNADVKEITEVEEIRGHLTIANTDEKMNVLIHCIPLARIAYGDHSFGHAEALVNLAQAYLDWKSYYIQALAHCKTAKMILSLLSTSENVKGNEDLMTLIRVTLCRLHLIEGRSLVGVGKCDEAQRVLDKAQRLLDSVKKLPTISESHITWFELRAALAFASLHVGQRSFGQAKSSILLALDIEKKKLAFVTPDKKELEKEKAGKEVDGCVKVKPAYFATARRVVDLYQQLGHVEMMRGSSADHAEVSKWYKQAIDVIKATFDLSPEFFESSETSRINDLKEKLKLKLANCHLKIAQSYVADNHFDMAESSVKKGLNVFEDCDSVFFIKRGKTKRSFHILHDELAKIHVKSQRNDDAITILNETLLSKRLLYGDFSMKVMETYNLLGSLYLVTEDVEKAVKCLQKFAAVCAVRYGTSDNRTKNAEATVNVLLAGQKDKSNNGNKTPTFKS